MQTYFKIIFDPSTKLSRDSPFYEMNNSFDSQTELAPLSAPYFPLLADNCFSDSETTGDFIAKRQHCNWRS